jgi:hypothetical protein
MFTIVLGIASSNSIYAFIAIDAYFSTKKVLI